MAHFFKRVLWYVMILLLALSVYNDITTEESSQNEVKQLNDVNDINTDQRTIRVQVKSGDTILSVTELLNTDLHTRIDIETIISDFKRLNPEANPYRLKAGSAYTFPIYNNVS